ncbi:MAG: hypothetical protein ACK55Z_26000, partial [bacterium]
MPTQERKVMTSNLSIRYQADFKMPLDASCLTLPCSPNKIHLNSGQRSMNLPNIHLFCHETQN